ncbi:peptidylprolyl isomerase [Gillisia sp. Hel_I_86]|uniref:peptidylprolyl isomerase n=1 Tax=Gillisia sp. Hel_I_86 TaxID=1249981 RepID=UPI0011996A4A|nr:peptidylprolyl isomerase [Gillisia sp. Hel_I_86]TVZ27603.1 peptidylprolyl isomerase [Gillisia sp. Hel_I_86]
MTRLLSFLFVSLILFFASCEDTQKSRSNTVKTPSAKTITKVKDSSEKITDTPKKKEGELFLHDEPMLVQEKLIPFLTEYGKKNPENKVRITTSFGDIDILLYNDTPLHRANMILLIKEGYFNGTFFHRVANGFVIQGGNSDNKETSIKRNNMGSYLIPSEFEAGHKHTRGAFAAAKYAEQNVSKASSPFEFFIVQSKRGAHHLDNDHTVYGRVIKGMEIVDKIAEQPIGEGEWPLINIPMTVEILK